MTSPLLILSQDLNNNKLDVNVNTGLTSSFGDFYNFKGVPLNESVTVGYGITLEKFLSNKVSIGGQLVFGNLEGRMYNYRYNETAPMDLRFKTKIFEHSLISSFSINRLIADSKENNNVNFYLRAGIGWLHWRNDVYDINTGKKVTGNGHSGRGLYKMTTETVFPVGLGIKIPLNPHFDLNFETTFRFVDTDILDGIKDGSRFDMYSYSFAGLSYNIFGTPANKIKGNKNREFITYNRPGYLYSDSGNDISKPTITEPNKESNDLLNIEVFTRKQPPVKEDNSGYNEILSDNNEVNNQSGHNSVVTDRIDESELSSYATDTDYHYGDQLSNNNERNLSVKVPVYNEQVFYKVQLLAVKNGPVSINGLKSRYDISAPVAMEYSDGWYRYVAGSYTDYSTALSECSNFINNGIGDAFVVSYKGSVRQPHLIR